MGQNIGIHKGRVQPAVEGLQQRNNHLEGQLRQSRRREEELQQRNNELEGQLRQRGAQMTTMDWVINRNDIQITHSHELGRGAWGVVYRGRFHYYEVAVKQMHEEIAELNRRVFEREVNMASTIRHPCLLLFIGATVDEEPPLLVTELLECSLRKKLFPSHGEESLPVDNEQAISLDVAYALHYLHERKPEPILHNDVSSSNVLLWRSVNGWRAKLSDYGTANFVRRSTINYAGAHVYSAPEYMTEGRATCKADVYSYGVLLCEMTVRQEPNREELETQIKMIEILHPHRTISRLVRRCVDQDPGDRPSMDEIIVELTNCLAHSHWLLND